MYCVILLFSVNIVWFLESWMREKKDLQWTETVILLEIDGGTEFDDKHKYTPNKYINKYTYKYTHI